MKQNVIVKHFFLSCLLLFALMLGGCASAAGTPQTESSQTASPQTSGAASEKKYVVVTTSFLQDMVKEIAGDSVNVDLIIPAGEDPHLYVARPEDYEKLEKADLVLYHGLHFEGKMSEILEKMGKEISRGFPEDRLNTMEVQGSTVVDPHFWFDIDLYERATKNAAEYLSELLPENQEMYTANQKAYEEKLKELDAYVAEQISSIPEDSRYLITPHDAFHYFANRYHITVMAPQGVSTDSEVSGADIQETIDFIVAHHIKAVFAESTTDPSRMEKLRQGAAAKGQDIVIVGGEGNELFSDSLAPAGQPGDNYIDMVKHNVNLMVKNLK